MSGKNSLRILVLSLVVVASGLACKKGGGGGGISAPLAPLGIAASVMSPSEAALAWLDTSSNETGFKIERAPDNGGVPGTFSVVGAAAKNATSFSDSGLTHSTTYHYRVRATNTTGDSAPTSEVMIRTGWVVEVAAGYDHSIFRRSDGTLWGFGYNGEGELGDGTNMDSASPVQVSGLTGVVEITAGEYHTIARKADGTIWSWGANWYGMLGDGTATDSNVPLQLVGLTDVVDIEAGNEHNLVRKSDGTVWGWGYNGDGQLGDGTFNDSLVPVQVPGLNGVQAISCGYYHSVVLKTDGTVWAWGYNGDGQLGDGTFNDSLVPVQVSGLTGVIAIAAGDEHTVALKSDGTVWAWGLGDDGELGNGANLDSNVPVQVTGLSGIVAIYAGGYFSAALKSDGTFFVWGYNGDGELGNGTFTDSNLPIAGPAIGKPKALALGPESAIAFLASGDAFGWGYNDYGQLGSGFGEDVLSPLSVKNLIDVLSFAGGESHGLARTSDGSVWSWGEDFNGQLGNGAGDSDDHLQPIQIAGFSGLTFVAAGEDHSLALKSDGTVWAWGEDSSGQVGDGVIGPDQPTPTQIAGLSGIIAIAAGEDHSLALMNDGTVWAWGEDGEGQMGDGVINPDKPTPAQIASLSNIIAIAAGNGFCLALKNDGTVWAWGDDEDGQLGDGVVGPDRPTPAQVPGLSGIIAIVAGEDHALALKDDGTVWAWGEDDDGQLGDGVVGTDQPNPTQIAGFSGIIALAAGDDFSVALKSDGTVWVFGENDDFEAGQDTAGADIATPTLVPGLVNVVAIAAGDERVFALLSDGTLRAWGDSHDGETGTGIAGHMPVPSEVVHPTP